MGVAALANMGALSKRNDSPETASRPFDATRDGFVLGEGAGVVVVESAEHALARGATPIAEIIGGALTADAFHISAPDPSGRGQARAMTNALRNCGRRARRDRLDRRPRHLDGAQRRDRDARDQDGLRLGGRDAGGQLAQVDDRPPRRGGRDRVGAGGAGRDPRPGHLADGEPPHAGPRAATSTTCRWSRARRRSTRSPSTASASAARTRSRSSAASRPNRGGQPRSGRPSKVSRRATMSSGIGRGRLVA